MGVADPSTALPSQVPRGGGGGVAGRLGCSSDEVEVCGIVLSSKSGIVAFGGVTHGAGFDSAGTIKG